MRLRFALLAFAPSLTLSHYTFPNIIVNGNTTGEWEYVRMTTNHYNQAAVDNPMSPQIRCFEDAARKPVRTVSVAAGSQIGFKSSNTMGHPGPQLWYMAKVPSGANAADWRGDGNVWFKIAQKGATVAADGVHFETGMTKLTTRIPSSLPAGEYLIRVEHIALHKPGTPQHYVSCGQIRVNGGGSGRPGPLVAFPGAYSKADPGLAYNMYGSPVKPYQPPGPPVWTG